MLELWSEKLLMSGGEKWIEWQSPNMTGYGTFGGEDYGVEDAGQSTSFPGYPGWRSWNYAASYDINKTYIQSAPCFTTLYTPKPVKISSIHIASWRTPADGYGVAGDISISMDNRTWTTLVTKIQNKDWRNQRTLTINSDQPCKYIRWSTTSSAHSWGASMSGITLYGFRKE